MRTARVLQPLAAIAVMCAATLVVSCSPGSPIRNAIRPASPHERYAASLRSAGLDKTGIGADWLAAAERALANPTPIELPMRETGYFPPEEAAARAWRFELPLGRRLVARVESAAPEPFRMYLDLFELRGDPAKPRVIASAEDGAVTLEHEVERAGSFILRLQPELLRGGRFTLTQETAATLLFPLDGRDSVGVASSYGDPRDAGGRDHEGIDLFAPRGTLVRAAADGRVTSVGTNNLGGNVVWVRTSRGHSHYYAHLDEQLARGGSRVRAGDPIGRVGNSGNARTTAPHLHFGIYTPAGPVDPFPFVHADPREPPQVIVDAGALGSWRRVSAGAARLRAAPDADARILLEMPRWTMVRIDGGVRDWYRVRLPDRTEGFVSGRLTEPAERHVRTTRTTGPVLDRPLPAGAPLEDIAIGTPLPVHGRFGEFLFVRTPQGRSGWLKDA